MGSNNKAVGRADQAVQQLASPFIGDEKAARTLEVDHVCDGFGDFGPFVAAEISIDSRVDVGPLADGSVDAHSAGRFCAASATARRLWRRTDSSVADARPGLRR